MELCPRCTSTVADGASTCPSCGAEIWQPGALTHQVAVTPAPVALVLPVPSAAPPPSPTAAEPIAAPGPAPAPPPPPTRNGNGNGYRAPHWVPLGPDPQLRSVVVNLPPQRLGSTDEEPVAAPPAARETVVPAAATSPRKPSRLAIAIGTVAPLLGVIVLIIALPAHGAKPTPAPAVASDADAQFNLRALAAAEETALTATKSYSTDRTALEAAGYQPAPGIPVTISAGTGEAGYCLVASAGRATSPWYLYDSEQGGLVSTAFATETLAQQACVDGAITSYVPIT